MAKGKSSKRLFSLQQSQFAALFVKDVVGTLQGQAGMYIARILLPTVLVLILFIMFHLPQQSDSGLLTPVGLDDLKLPRCYELAGKNNSKGLGAKSAVPDCKLLAYFPMNELTSSIMQGTARSMGLNNSDLIGYELADEFYADSRLKLYAVEFWVDDNSTIESAIKSMSVIIHYNQSYLDMPHFYDMYGDEKIANKLTFNYVIDMASWSSFPLAIHSHISAVITGMAGVDYKPTFTSNPKAATEITSLPNPMISLLIYAVGFIFQFIFVCLHIQQDKQGTLDALRLAGVSDIIYWAELLVFQYGIFLLGLCGQLFTIYLLPGGCGIFIAIQPIQIICISLVFGLYSTTLAIFINMVLNLKTMGIVVVTGLYVILLVLHCMFKQFFIYDPTIIGAFLMNVLRLLYPFAYCTSAVSIVILSAKVEVLKDLDTMADYMGVHKKMLWAEFSECEEELGFVDLSVKFVPGAPATSLGYAMIQSLVFFVFGWFFGEWLPRNASACRTPWRVIYQMFKNQEAVGYTSGQIMQANKYRFKSQVEGRLRRALTQEEANRCLQEVVQHCDEAAKKNMLDILTRQATGNEVLIAHHLHKSFNRPATHKQRLLLGKEHDAVQSVSLSLTEGQIYGLCGYSGAGKTTVQAMLTGSIAMDRPGYKFFHNTKEMKQLINNAWVGNQYSIRDDIVNVRRVLSYCPQFNTSVYKNLTVEQNLRFTCRIRNIPSYDHDRIIQSLLQRLNIVEQRDKLISSMSGGQQRRVVIAMTLVNPKAMLCLFDEPTSGADPHTKRIIWANLKMTATRTRKSPVIVGSSIGTARVHRVREPRPGIILTSHDLAEMEFLCDEIAIMNAGQISAIGTPLGLKRQFGNGFTLNVILRDAKHAGEFKQVFQEHLNQFQASGDICTLLDQAGANLIYSFANNQDLALTQTIRFIEQQIAEGALVEDFCLERTSLDEVFVKVGQMFNQSSSVDKDVIVKEELSHGGQVAHDRIQEIEYGSDEQQDEYMNEQQVNIAKLTKEEVQKILSPPKEPPSTLKIIMYKLAHNDKMHRLGWLSVVLTPILILLFNFILTLVLKSIQDTAYKNFEMQTDNLDPFCQNCQLARAFQVPLRECEGFDSWGFQSICTSIYAAQGEAYLPQITWYGGSSAVWPEQQNLYNTQQYPSQLYVFDKQKKLMHGSIDPILRQNEQGVKTISSVDIDYEGTTQQYQYIEYQYTTPNGEPISPKVENVFKQLGKVNSLDFMQTWDVRPIAVQQITANNEKLNLFDLYRDQELLDGYNYYDGSSGLQQAMQLILARDGLSDPMLVSRADECKDKKRCIRSDDVYLIQKYQQYVASMIPMGFVDLDWQGLPPEPDDEAEAEPEAETEEEATEYRPLISAFSPARTYLRPYENYRIQVRVIKSPLLNSIIDQYPEMGGMINIWNSVQLAPMAQFNIIEMIDFDEVFISPQTAAIDINTRLMNVALRKELNDSDINIRFGVQMFEHKMLDVIDLTMMQMSLIVSTILMVICTYHVLVKYGQHIVQDRERQIRLQFFLSGISQRDYWLANICYCMLQSIAIHLVIGIFGRYVFRIQALCRFDILTYIVLAAANALSQVGISLFFASFSKRQSGYNVMSIIVLLVSIVVVFFQITKFRVDAPWYGFVFPSLGYSTLFMACSFFGSTIPELSHSSFGLLLLWIIVYSVILIVIGIYLDQRLPINGYAPALKERADTTQQASMNKERASSGMAMLQSLVRSPAARQTIGSATTDAPALETALLNAVPESVDIKSQRDKSCALEEDRMDIDVFHERCYVGQHPNVASTAPFVVKNLQKQFGNFLAIRDLTFHVPAATGGSVFAILGANGAAKTTLFNCALGLIRPSFGQVFLNGFDMANRAQAQKAYHLLGVCPQLDAYIPNLTIREHLRIFAALHGVPHALLDEITETIAAFVQLCDVLDRPAGQVSGGQRRRMSLALALVG